MASEEDLLQQALSAPLGLVVRGRRERFQRALATLRQADPLYLDLRIFGPDRQGQLYLLRATPAREKLEHD